MKLRASIGKIHQAEITGEFHDDFKEFVKQILKRVPETESKASNGWVCGAHFRPAYRHSQHFQHRYLLSLDYDHIKPDDVERVLKLARGGAFLAYTTWSHDPDHPRIRVWIPLSRPASAEEFQAVSRRVAARADIELAARESHTPAQFMYRPTRKAGVAFQYWADTDGPYLDVDKVLGEYDDWRDKSSWPRRKDGDELFDTSDVASPLDKPGLVGLFCRAFRISEAIERFQLPYKPGSSETRWTYTGGSSADGAVSYDDDTKLHSYHDTDPARGQHNAYDLVRLHRFGKMDTFDRDALLEERPSTGAMRDYCRTLSECAEYFSAGFEPLPDELPAVERGGAPPTASAGLPAEVPRAAGNCTDLKNAERIQKAFGHLIVSVAGEFYVWEGTHWAPDTHHGSMARKLAELSQLVQQEAHYRKAAYGANITEDQAAQCEALTKYASKCADKAKMDACKGLLAPLLDRPASMLNRDRRLFNALNCTINLETGETFKHRQGDYLTICAPTEYDPAAKCPRFEQFILEIFDNDTETAAFMKRWLGYCITGEVRAQAIVFHIGRSGNGKSTLMNVIEHVIGAYAYTGPRSLLNGKSEIKNDVAKLVGKRMVTLNETNEGESYDQAQLKDLTGSNTLSARFLHKEFFEFVPTHKLQIFTNHEPTLTGGDEGIWRRLLLLRYRIRFGTPEQVATGEFQRPRDDKLEDIMKAEAPGVLRWLVEGAREWYAVGLAPPAAVLKDTRGLRDEQDTLRQFLSERIVKDPAARLPHNGSTESLYAAYKGWTHDNGHRPFSKGKFLKRVRTEMPELKEDAWTEKGGFHRGFLGIRLATNGEAS